MWRKKKITFSYVTVYVKMIACRGSFSIQSPERISSFSYFSFIIIYTWKCFCQHVHFCQPKTGIKRNETLFAQVVLNSFIRWTYKAHACSCYAHLRYLRWKMWVKQVSVTVTCKYKKDKLELVKYACFHFVYFYLFILKKFFFFIFFLWFVYCSAHCEYIRVCEVMCLWISVSHSIRFCCFSHTQNIENFLFPKNTFFIRHRCGSLNRETRNLRRKCTENLF